jgi:hypothetical protein
MGGESKGRLTTVAEFFVPSCNLAEYKSYAWKSERT